MPLRASILALASLTALASHGTEIADPPPTIVDPSPALADPAPATVDPPAAAVPTSTPPSPPPGASEEVLVEAPEPRYVAPTLRDRIGRVWAPVMINGQGPFRLVLDTGATGSAVIQSVATRIGAPLAPGQLRLIGATGSSLVSAIRVDSIEVGDLWLGKRNVAIVEDVFGGADGVLGADGLSDKRIVIEFLNDYISIQRSRAARHRVGFTRVPVRIRDDLDSVTRNRAKRLSDASSSHEPGGSGIRRACREQARSPEGHHGESGPDDEPAPVSFSFRPPPP